jgi:hypothetical protein
MRVRKNTPEKENALSQVIKMGMDSLKKYDDLP